MGVVYLVEDTTLGRKVAIKLLQPTLFADDDSVRRFQAEARAVAQLFHPHIVPVNAFESNEDRLIIEMPYLEGGSLGRFVHGGGRFPEVVTCAAEVLDALAVCHRKGIVHRDVKPSNVLLDVDGRALLGDFGLAKVVWERINDDFMTAATGSIFVGTPRYAPPEAWESADATPAWDLYSVGVMLYEGLSGRAPYEGRSVLEYIRAMEQAPPPPLKELRSDISPRLSDLVHGLLCRTPAKRLQHAEDVRARLMESDEYVQLSRVGAGITRKVPLPRRVSQSRGLARIKGHIRKSAPWVGWTLFLVAVAVLFIRVPLLPAAPGEPNLRDAPLLQSEVLADARLNVDGLLAAARFEAPVQARVFAAAGNPSIPHGLDRWLLLSTPDTGSTKILAFGELRLASLVMLAADDSGKASIAGHWGAFRDASSLVCWDGEVRGSVSRLSGGTSLLCELEYDAPGQGVHFHETMVLDQVTETDTSFLWAFEEDSLLPALLHNELIPRDDAWRARTAVWLPAIHSAVTVARRMDAEAAVVAIDGRGIEPVWMDDADDPWYAPALGWPATVRPELRAHAAPDGLTILLSVQRVLPAETRIEVSLLPGYRVPLANATRYAVAFEDGQAVDSYALRGGRREDWPCNWPVATIQSVSWNAELHIPYASIGGGKLEHGTPCWRVTIHVRERGADPASAPLAAWPVPFSAGPEHGVLVWFRPPETGPPP